MNDGSNSNPADSSSAEKPRLESLLRVSRSIQDMEGPGDFEHVVRVLFEELRGVGIRIAGLAIQRLTDKASRMFELYEMLPGERYRTRVAVREPTFAEWQKGQIVHFPNTADPSARPLLGPDYESAYASLGIEVLSILHIPNANGMFTLRSDVAFAFDQEDVGFLRTVSDFLGVGMSRVADIEELAAARDAAEAANTAKDVFLANMSHELRTPLNAIIGMAHVLIGSGLSDVQREYVQTIDSGGQLLLSHINSILDYARLQASDLNLQHDTFDPRLLVEQSCHLLANGASSKGILLDVQISPTVPPRLVGDAGRIRQILINLVSNAIKFTHKGSVTVECAAEAGVHETDTTLIVSVRDTGIGIPAEKQTRLFKRFSQADETISRTYGGSGLGLAICHELVSLMDGQIACASEAGEGSTFTFRLPLTRAEVDEREADTPIAVTADGTPLRVLLAEDVRANQIFVHAVLARYGVRAVSVQNGKEALEAVQHDTFDLVLMDMHMPIMDGLTASRHIRAWEAGADRTPVPIVALTASSYVEDQRACEEAGMNGYLVKPFTPEALEQTVARFCAGTAEPPPPAPDTAVSGTQLFDYERFTRRTAGDSELARMMIQEFYTAVPEYLREAQHSDSPQNAVHRLHGASGTVSALRLALVCRTIEDDIRNNARDSARSGIARLPALVAETMAAMERATGIGRSD